MADRFTARLYEPTQAAPVQLDLAVPSTEKEAA